MMRYNKSVYVTPKIYHKTLKIYLINLKSTIDIVNYEHRSKTIRRFFQTF